MRRKISKSFLRSTIFGLEDHFDGVKKLFLRLQKVGVVVQVGVAA